MQIEYNFKGKIQILKLPDIKSKHLQTLGVNQNSEISGCKIQTPQTLERSLQFTFFILFYFNVEI